MTIPINADKIHGIVEEYIQKVMDLNDLPGLAIAIAANGSSASPEFIKSTRGYRDFSTQKPLDEDDIFHCASVSKLFTSSAIMTLVEAGKLNLYDRLCNLLPDWPMKDGRFREIRLWNLLSHTSGLGDVADYHWYDCETDDESLKRYVYSDEVTAQPMLWDPQLTPEFYGPEYDEAGEPVRLFRYSNVAYEILGHIVSNYSVDPNCGEPKLSYEDFVAKHLLKKAGMTHSTMKTYERPGWNPRAAEMDDSTGLVFPYEKGADRSIQPVEYYPYTRQHAPSSTLTSNLEDLLRWGCAHLRGAAGKDNGILQRETYDSIWRDYSTVPNNGEKMGLGWFMRRQRINVSGPSGSQTREFILYGHEGMDDGFRASFWILPELDLVTVVLSNLSNAPVKRINKGILEQILG